MKVGILTTSWPSEARPWAGHFVRDQAIALARLGVDITIVTPAWSGHGDLVESAGLALVAPRVLGAPGSLARSPGSGLRALHALRRATRTVEAEHWLAHWWPTRWALGNGRSSTAVLHGSDVDWLARLPRAVRHRIGRDMDAVAVAQSVARRFACVAGVPTPPVVAMGAHRAEEPGPVPEVARAWLASDAPRILTVGREAPGKGWSTMRAAAALLPDIAWLGLTPRDGVGPSGVRRLIAEAHLVVVPSQKGPGLPSEGLPHIITQAMVAGTPVVGGPCPAVQEALASLGQPVVRSPGAEALADAVRDALEAGRQDGFKDRAREAGECLHWPNLAPRWLDVLKEGRTPRDHRRTTGTPSC